MAPEARAATGHRVRHWGKTGPGPRGRGGSINNRRRLGGKKADHVAFLRHRGRMKKARLEPPARFMFQPEPVSNQRPVYHQN